MPQNDEQYMRDLYDRFRADVMNNNNSEFYEEDELLDIYDFAQDEGDDMVLLYVLLAGARLYPDSKFLDERKAFFLSAVNDQSARAMFDRKGREESALWGVLDLSLKNYPDGNPEDGLTELLASGVRFSCEALIRLIDTLHELDRDDLIAENVHILEERTEFKELLYYEASEALIHNDRYISVARDLAEELTKNEPFNPDDWVQLAKAEFGMEHFDEAIVAADYALAIDPSHVHAQLMKGLALATSDDTRHEAIALLSDVLRVEPENSLAVKALAEAYRADGKKGAALEVYRGFMVSSEANSFVLLDILKMHPDDPVPFLELFSRQTGHTERKWLEMAAQLANEHELLGALDMLDYYHERYTLREGMEYYIRINYEASRYERVIELFDWCLEQSQAPEGIRYGFSPFCYLLVAGANLMTGNYRDAMEISDALIKQDPPITDLDDMMRWRGMKATLKYICELASNPDRISINAPRRDPVADMRPKEFFQGSWSHDDNGKLSDQ